MLFSAYEKKSNARGKTVDVIVVLRMVVLQSSGIDISAAYAQHELLFCRLVSSGTRKSLRPEDGCLWIYGTDDQQTIAFTDDGLEYLQELLAEHKRRLASPRS